MVVVVEGSRSSVFESQVTGEQKRRDGVEDLSESRGAAAKQQFSHVSLIKLVDMRKEMEERQTEMKGSRGCRRLGRLIDAVTTEQPGEGEPPDSIDSETPALHFDIQRLQCFLILDMASFDDL